MAWESLQSQSSLSYSHLSTKKPYLVTYGVKSVVYIFFQTQPLPPLNVTNEQSRSCSSASVQIETTMHDDVYICTTLSSRRRQCQLISGRGGSHLITVIITPTWSELTSCPPHVSQGLKETFLAKCRHLSKASNSGWPPQRPCLTIMIWICVYIWLQDIFYSDKYQYILNTN